MVLIPPGTLWMGSPTSEIDDLIRQSPDEKRENYEDETQHRITLTKPFYLGKYEVTQEQYAAVMNGANPSSFSAKGDRKDRVKDMDTRRFPVESMLWNDIAEEDEKGEFKPATFLARLNQKAGGGRLYGLPSEAQWEYACRGGACLKDSKPFHLDTGPSESLSPLQA